MGLSLAQFFVLNPRMMSYGWDNLLPDGLEINWAAPIVPADTKGPGQEELEAASIKDAQDAYAKIHKPTPPPDSWGLPPPGTFDPARPGIIDERVYPQFGLIPDPANPGFMKAPGSRQVPNDPGSLANVNDAYNRAGLPTLKPEDLVGNIKKPPPLKNTFLDFMLRGGK
jgi:hypothetical protein